jgi:ribosomal-protein-alanine N-acetyltransferase
VEIVTPTCVLRAPEPEDADSIARHANERDIWLNLRDAFPHPYTRANADGYISHVLTQSPRTSFLISVDGSAVGSISLKPGSDIERVGAEIGYWLAKEYWGRGIMTDALRALTGYAFNQLGLNRVFAVPFTHNAASARVLEKAGYAREGVMRRSAIKDGKLLDQYLYAACDDVWTA